VAKKSKSGEDNLTADSSPAAETASEVESSSVTPLESPSARSGGFGVVAIVSSLALILIVFLSPIQENSKFTLEADTTLKISLTLSSREFTSSGMLNPCDGIGSIKGIKNSIITVANGGWKVNPKIGSGTLSDEGNCVYNINVQPPESFEGGVVQLSAVFPFGFSPVYKIDVGDKAPWSVARMKLPLD
jgi:hypothetical protein